MMKKLLIIDDDSRLLESLRVVFEGHYEVETSLSCEQAAFLIEQSPPDILLLDIVFPGTNGIDFLRSLRETCPRVPVVMISGGASIRPVMEALELGASDYVRKPFHIDELRLTVARALHVSELEKQLDALKKTRPGKTETEGLPSVPMKQAVEDFERNLIEKALASADGVQTRAAQILGTTRRILQYRMNKLNITVSSSA